ncbi:PH domain-containing protein [Curtobacterium sp. RRHDQ10]|uniref:PH domain-containing protein n=1 Tax=Curtobacterium phyllosphaerae TaxID=3413379 RepID=UPI003BF31513
MTESSSGPAPDPERVIARFRPHARRLFWPVVRAFVVCALGGFGIGLFRADWAWLNLVVAGLVVVLLVLGSVVPLFRWLGSRTVVTTRRLVQTTGSVVRTRHELLHSRGYDVTVRRTGLQGMFRTGDVLVFPGEDRPLVLPDVPSADLVVAVLHDLVEVHDLRRRGPEPSWQQIVDGTARPADRSDSRWTTG